MTSVFENTACANCSERKSCWNTYFYGCIQPDGLFSIICGHV